MPPGNARGRMPVKVVERTTLEACIAIARRIQADHQREGDLAGAEAAQGVAEKILAELMGPTHLSGRSPG